MPVRSWARGSVLTLGIAIGFLPADAWAYIDPGSGALVLQAVLSGLLGAAFLARKALRRMLGWLLTAVGGSGSSATTPPDA